MFVMINSGWWGSTVVVIRLSAASAGPRGLSGSREGHGSCLRSLLLASDPPKISRFAEGCFLAYLSCQSGFSPIKHSFIQQISPREQLQ